MHVSVLPNAMQHEWGMLRWKDGKVSHSYTNDNYKQLKLRCSDRALAGYVS